MDNMLSWKSNWRHAVLEYQIKEIDTAQDITRSGIMFRAIEAAEKVEDWRPVKEKLSLIPRIDIQVPASMQAKLDGCFNNILNESVRKKILSDLAGDIERLQTQYMIQLLWLNYLQELKTTALNVGAEQKANFEDITGADMVKILVELILLNRDADADTISHIKKILIDWSSKR